MNSCETATSTGHAMVNARHEVASSSKYSHQAGQDTLIVVKDMLVADDAITAFADSQYSAISLC